MARHRGCLDEPAHEPEPERDRRRPGRCLTCSRPQPRRPRRRAAGRPPWPRAPGSGMSRSRRCAPRARASSAIMPRDRPGQEDRAAASTAPPAAGELLAKATDGRPSLLDDVQALPATSGGTRAAPTPPAPRRAPDRGYTGSCRTIRDYVHPFRDTPAPPRPPRPGPPKARDITRWMLTDPDHLDDDDKARLAGIRERCPHLDALAGHVTEFAKILTGLHGDRLDDWLTAVEADDQPDLHSFARGIRRDHAGRHSTASPCPGAQESSRATSTGSFCGINLSGFARFCRGARR